MLARAGTAMRAIRTLAAIASIRPPFAIGRFRRPRRTETTIAIAIARISSSPRLEKGFGIGRMLYVELKATVMTRTRRYARRTHHAGRNSGRNAWTCRYQADAVTRSIARRRS